MRLPSGWDTEKASGWWYLHHLIHTSCGYRTHNAYDLWAASGPLGEADARRVVYGHECDGGEA
jgi:hypothetical protein